MVTSHMNTAQELLTGPLPQKGYQQDALFAGDKVPPFPFFIENPADLHRADLPTNSSRESHGDQELSRVNNVRPETSPNPLPDRCQFDHPTRMVVPSEQRERGTSPELRGDNGFIDTNPLPDRCQFTFSDGRQCTMARCEIHPSLCRFHSEREDQLFGDPAPGGNVVGAALDLPELHSACRDLTTAAGVNRALAQVFRLLAQRRISRQEAATFGHLAQLLLRTISAMRILAGENPAANVYLSAGESHGHQELSPVHKAELRGVDKDHQELSPDNKVAGFENGARADSRLTPRREANAAPASCTEADDAASIVIPSLPSADERVAVPGVSYDQRVQTVASNPRKMNTCAKPVSNPSKMNTYEIAELKVAHNEHLRKTGEVANAQVPSAGSPAYAAFAHAGVAAGTKQISPVREHRNAGVRNL